MVLNKSKWDHKAKLQYLRKHNLTQPRKQEAPRKKWSSKKETAPEENLWLQQIRSGEEYEEWTDTDEVILNHFYPNISGDDISEDEKKSLKKQILATIRAQLEDKPEHEEAEGIYLGTRPEPEIVEEAETLDIPDLETKLDEFIIADFGLQKPRSLLKSTLAENLLEEYGMQDYKSTVKDHDYNAPEKFDLDKLNAKDLHGFRIGLDLATVREKPVQPARELSAAEMEVHKQRAKKLEHARFHNQIKKTFGTSDTRSKLLEINNIDESDESQMAALNGRLSRVLHTDKVSEQDLDELLGFAGAPLETKGPGDPLDFLEQMEDLKGSQRDTVGKRATLAAKHASDQDQKFLDDLLGI